MNCASGLGYLSDESNRRRQGSLPDSGIHDLNSPSSTHRLLWWQDIILQIWYEHNRRKPTEKEASLFSSILKSAESRTKIRLDQLHDSDRKESDLGNARNGSLENGDPRKSENNDNQTDIYLSVAPHPLSTDRVNSVQAPGPYSQKSRGDSFEWSSCAHQTTTEAFCFNFDYGNGVFDTSGDDYQAECSTGAELITLPPVHNQGVYLQNSSKTKSFVDPMSLTNLAPFFTNLNPCPGRPEVTLTESLRTVILAVMRTRTAEGCRAIKSHEKQEGIFECTLKCRRRFKAANDLFRHEATIFPQEFWFCTLCGDLENASKTSLFSREDKMRNHNKIKHSDLNSASHCKVPNIPANFPERCTVALCTHRPSSWEDRCQHIRWHYRRGDKIGKYLSKPFDGDNDGGDSSNNDDDDDDDNNNGHDNDQNDDNSTNDGSSNDHQPNSDSDKSPPADHDKDGGADDNSRSEPDYFSSFLDWSNASFWGLYSPTDQLPLAPNVEISTPVNSQLQLSRAQKLPDHLQDIKAEILVVKQHSEMRVFERELRAYSYLRKRAHLNVVEYFGSFIQVDSGGIPTFNLVLENTQCDLNHYFSKNDPPKDPAVIFKFWKQLNGIAEALEAIHSQFDYAGWHGDVKPESILWVNEVFKLANFGFSRFIKQEKGVMVADIQSGSATYGAPELEFSSGTKTTALVTQKIDTWSFGCVMSEAATWIQSGCEGVQAFSQNRASHFRDDAIHHGAPFHDGAAVLQAVASSHEALLPREKRGDCITGQILDLIENDLLVGNPTQRFGCTNLRIHMNQIFQSHLQSPLQSQDNGDQGLAYNHQTRKKDMPDETVSTHTQGIIEKQLAISADPSQSTTQIQRINWPYPTPGNSTDVSLENLYSAEIRNYSPESFFSAPHIQPTSSYFEAAQPSERPTKRLRPTYPRGDPQGAIIGCVLSYGKFTCQDGECKGLTFGRLADLRRHWAQTHVQKREEYFCQIPGCSRAHNKEGGKGRSFGNRKDKRDEHMRVVHPKARGKKRALDSDVDRDEEDQE